jgi:hypothetical protein
MQKHEELLFKLGGRTPSIAQFFSYSHDVYYVQVESILDILDNIKIENTKYTLYRGKFYPEPPIYGMLDDSVRQCTERGGAFWTKAFFLLKEHITFVSKRPLSNMFETIT